LCFVLGDGKASQSYNEGKGKEILSFEQILFYVVAYHVFLTEGGNNGSQPTGGNGT
jgi:hypothetical protein